MPDCTCQARYETALSEGRDGLAEFIETRCERSHQSGGGTTGPERPPRPPDRTPDPSGAMFGTNDNRGIQEES